MKQIQLKLLIKKIINEINNCTKPIILETHLEDIFHATGIFELVSILKDNAIKLSFTGGTFADEELNKNYPYFLSASRAKYGNYSRTKGSNKYLGHHVIIHLNGSYLVSKGFKIFPVDYWGNMGGKENSEQEERIVSNKDKIYPLKNFVKDIHVYVNNDAKNSFIIEKYNEINDLSKTYNIPIYFYPKGTEEYFKQQRISKSVRDVSNIMDKPNWSEDELRHKEYLASRKTDKDKILRTFLDIYYERPVDTQNYPGKNVMAWLLYHPHDAQSQIAAEIHNYKKEHLPIFNEIVQIMKKHNFKTVRELVNFVIKREQDKNKRT